MSRAYWDKKHDKYAMQDWIDKPSILLDEKGRTYKDDILLVRFVGRKPDTS